MGSLVNDSKHSREKKIIQGKFSENRGDITVQLIFIRLLY